MKRLLLTRALLILAALLVLSACGGDDKSKEPKAVKNEATWKAWLPQ